MLELYAMEESYALRYLEALENVTPEERSAALDRFSGQPLPDILQLSEDGTEASIAIMGPLSPDGPGPLARFLGFGGTSYRDIVDSAQLVADDPSIKTVRFLADTPGGSVRGMDQARQAIADLTAAGKTTVFENQGTLASAGYHLATAANRIEAAGPTVTTGSIGVVIAGLDPTKAMEKAGLRRIQIVSRNAPNKRPDLSTDEGIAVLQSEADAMERVFIKAVADGRGTTTQDVIDNYGKGGTLIAQDPDPSQPDAIKVGMIDGLISGGASSGEDNGATAGPTTFKDFPIVDRPWDGAAADRRVRRFVGAEDAPNERYRQAFFWYDSQNAANFGAYKLGFVDVVDGRLVAIWNGISAANGAMSGARGRRVQIPNADRPRAQAHIDRYRTKWQRMKENSASAIGTGGGSSSLSTAAEGGGHNTRTSNMDLMTLKTEQPALYAEAVAVGVTQERERVESHLTMGEASGDMELALTCVKDGSELTPSINAKHMAAGINKQAQAARGGESEEDLNPDAGGGNGGEGHDAQVAAVLAEQMGVEIDA